MAHGNSPRQNGGRVQPAAGGAAASSQHIPIRNARHQRHLMVGPSTVKDRLLAGNPFPKGARWQENRLSPTSWFATAAPFFLIYQPAEGFI